MRTSSVIATRYANALYDKAHEEQAVDKTLADLKKIDGFIHDHPVLNRLFFSAATPRKQLWAALEDLLSTLKISPLVQSFIGVLTQNRRQKALRDVIVFFEQKKRDAEGVHVVDVTVAQSLSGPVQKKITTALEKRLATKVEARIHVDPALIGGFTVKIGSSLVDCSVGGQLDQLHLSLKGV